MGKNVRKKSKIQRAIDLAFTTRLVNKRNLHSYSEYNFLRQLFDFIDFGVVLDIGANEGQFYQRIRHSGYKDKVVSFEPIPEILSRLKEKSQSDPNWVVEGRVVTSQTQESIEFNVMKSSQMSSVLAPKESGVALLDDLNTVENRVRVGAISLSDVLDQYGQTEHVLLKLDTQGHDLEILNAGSSRMSDVSVILTELSFKSLYDSPNDWRSVMAFMDDHNFALSAIYPNNAGHFPVLLESDAIFIRNDLIA